MAREFPEQLNIADHFLEARLREGLGKKVAVLCGDESFTYAEIAARSHRWGNVLAELSVQPEQRVLIALPDGPDFVAALFGTLALGAVVVMANPALARDEIAHLYRYTRAKVVAVHAEGLATFEEALADVSHPPRLLVVGGPAGSHDSLDELLVGASQELELYPTHRDDAAIWLFSGGTTGRPKAVVQPHRSFANTTELYAHGVLGYGPGDITLSVPKLFFGYATGANLLFPFSVGATCVLFPERCTAETLFGLIARHRPSVLINVPTMVSKLLEHPGAAAQDLACLRFSTSAGEALPAELHARWMQRFGVELLDGLGTAEMWHVFIANRPGDVHPGTLGKVVPGFEVKACDEHGHSVPPGEPGSLWVRGGSRAIAYWQRQEQTEEAFRGEWYVSGDMISIDAEGVVTYCGRGDDMLKVGGKWLSPGDVENCLLTHPAVKECAVVGVEDAQGLTKPHAFAVASEPSEALAAELRQYVADELAPYKAPRRVVFLDSLPQTHLGKVDRGRLRTMS